MRIAHVYKDFMPPVCGGIERYVADVAAATAARGFEVEVHCAGVRRSRVDRTASGVVVFRYREVSRLLSSPISLGLPAAARGTDADVVHLHGPNPLGEVGVLLNRGAPACVASFHAPIVRQRFLEPLYGRLRSRVFARCHAILVASEQMAGAGELARHRERVSVLPYGVSPSLLAPGSAADRGATSQTRLLFVGRLVYYKGLDVLLQAMASLRDEDVRLTIVGRGPLGNRLRAQAAALGVGRSVVFAGSPDDAALQALYAEHDVFVMPSGSRAEAFGMAMCEAMANGLPAISTSVGTATDWVNLDGVTGLVVPPGSPAALAGAIRRLAGDVGLRTRLARQAASRTRREFSFDRHVDGLVDTYEAAARWRR